MKKLITTMIVALMLALGTPAYAQDASDAGATAEAVAAPVVAPEPEDQDPVPVLDDEVPEVLLPKAEVPAEDATSPALARVLNHIIELVATLLMIIMAWAVRRAGSYFTEKTKIEIPAKTEAMIAEWGRKAVHYGTEKAHQYNADNAEAMKGPEKLEVALGFGIGLAEEYGMTSLAKEKLTKYIESHLGEKRTSNNPA